ncbi:MAG: relaxase/mobilization nuclease domain-containing protein [Solobacterium sp.]|nr:relaxase/mobilization nuclease domain-containing protein [Solobacterium sp.]
MAITKIHPISSTLKKAINYITNAHKTDEKIFVSSFACSPEVADLQFDRLNKKTDRNGSVLAHHLIQSFLPGEVEPEVAHEIGKELANRHLSGNYQYIVTTHVDKDHIHNHIIFNAVSLTDRKHYRSNSRSYYQIREISDQLCKEHHLSIVMPSDKGKSYYEYQQVKQGTSYKQKLKDTIDNIIPICKTFDELLEKLERLGYEIKRGKYISCRASDQERFTRLKTLGNSYTEEAIKQRIKTKERPFPFKKKATNYIDTTQEKYQGNIGLKKWADKQNLKFMAQSMLDLESHGYHNYAELEKAESDMLDKLDTVQRDLVDAEDKYKFINNIINCLETRNDYKPIYDAYKKAKDRDKYSVDHSSEIAQYKAAVTEIKKHYPNGKVPPLKSLIKERNQLHVYIEKELKPAHKNIKKEYSELSKLKKNIDVSIAKEKATPKHGKDQI